MANTISIELELDESGAIKGLKQLEGKAQGAGKRAGDNFEKGLSKGLTGVTKNLLKLGAVFGGVFSAVKIGQAANEQIDAVERLNKALQVNNDFTQEASQDLQNYAAELQKVTEFGDELIINQLALAKSFGATNEQAKLTAEAATGLAKEFGISLESATRNIAKSLGGFGGELQEIIPEIKDFSTEQLKAGAAIEFLNGRFRDSAKDIPTLTFASRQLFNTFGDLLEEIGKFGAESGILRLAIKNLNLFFQDTIKVVKEFASTFDFIDDVAIPLSRLGDAIIQNAVKPLEILFNIGKAVAGALGDFFEPVINGIITAFNTLTDVAVKAAAFVGKTISGIKAELVSIVEDADADSQSIFAGVLDTELSDKLSAQNQVLREGLEETSAILDEQAEKDKERLRGLSEGTKEVVDVAKDSLLGLRIGFADTSKSIAEQTKQIGATIRNSLAKGISGSIQLVVTNLIKGKNAFEDFGKFVLGVFGDLAIQLGEFFILQGIAVESLKGLQGAAALAAGAALVALGTLLKSASGGGGGAAASSGASGGGGAADPSIASDGGVIATGEPEEQEQQLNQVVIQGDVFDTEETGLRIFEVVSNLSEKNGNVIVGGAFA